MSLKHTDGRSGRVYTESGDWLNEADYLKHNTTAFNEKKTTEKTQQLILNAALPLSDQRDKITETNGGTVTKVGAEYRVRAATTTNSVGGLQSRQRGNYLSGNVLEAGQGVRIPTQPTGDAEIKIGYWKDNTGMYFLHDSDGVHIVVENGSDGVIEKKSQDEWNLDTLDGSDNTDNPSGAELDTTNGIVYQIPFVYYGYGPIVFEIGIKRPNGQYKLIPIHTFSRDGNISIDQPNLPLNVEVSSNTSGTQLDAFVAGRQISTFGKKTPVDRPVKARRLNREISTSFRPLISFKHRTGHENILVVISSLSIISDVDFIYELQRNATLDGNASFDYQENYQTGERATVWDVTAGDTYTNGHTIYEDIGIGGGGAVKASKTSNDLPPRPISEEDTITLAVRAVSGTGTISVGNLGVNEKW